MNTLLLDPNDVLFFRDGRPMGGSSAGHGAAWPLPTVTNTALHAALWRAGLKHVSHSHDRKAGGEKSNGGEYFGSLATVGPFPVCTKGSAATWFFPRPLDAVCDTERDADGRQTGVGNIETIAKPAPLLSGAASSNPLPFAVGSRVPPSKETPDPWWSEGAWAAYLGSEVRDADAARIFTRKDADFSDAEASIGIGIDPATGSQDGERFYSAHYLRLREGWKIGLVAGTQEKTESRGERIDLVSRLFEANNRVLVGGQQRLCTVEKVHGHARLPMPLGQTDDFPSAVLPDKSDAAPEYLVKWVLLTPAIFPRIEAGEKNGKTIMPHCGGWLPNWILDGGDYKVMLKTPNGPRDVEQQSREQYRASVRAAPAIDARLVAAMVGKPVPVTGWSIGTPDHDTESPTARAPGAKPTHLAVPAGSVYYFACGSAAAAKALAEALNWHGKVDAAVPAAPTTTPPSLSTIRNRRSTLMGEKGFGIGVCGTWENCSTTWKSASQ